MEVGEQERKKEETVHFWPLEPGDPQQAQWHSSESELLMSSQQTSEIGDFVEISAGGATAPEVEEGSVFRDMTEVHQWYLALQSMEQRPSQGWAICLEEAEKFKGRDTDTMIDLPQLDFEALGADPQGCKDPQPLNFETAPGPSASELFSKAFPDRQWSQADTPTQASFQKASREKKLNLQGAPKTLTIVGRACIPRLQCPADVGAYMSQLGTEELGEVLRSLDLGETTIREHDPDPIKVQHIIECMQEREKFPLLDQQISRLLTDVRKEARLVQKTQTSTLLENLHKASELARTEYQCRQCGQNMQQLVRLFGPHGPLVFDHLLQVPLGDCLVTQVYPSGTRVGAWTLKRDLRPEDNVAYLYPDEAAPATENQRHTLCGDDRVELLLAGRPNQFSPTTHVLWKIASDICAWAKKTNQFEVVVATQESLMLTEYYGPLKRDVYSQSLAMFRQKGDVEQVCKYKRLMEDDPTEQFMHYAAFVETVLPQLRRAHLRVQHLASALTQVPEVWGALDRFTQHDASEIGAHLQHILDRVMPRVDGSQAILGYTMKCLIHLVGRMEGRSFREHSFATKVQVCADFISMSRLTPNGNGDHGIAVIQLSQMGFVKRLCQRATSEDKMEQLLRELLDPSKYCRKDTSKVLSEGQLSSAMDAIGPVVGQLASVESLQELYAGTELKRLVLASPSPPPAPQGGGLGRPPSRDCGAQGAAAPQEVRGPQLGLLGGERPSIPLHGGPGVFPGERWPGRGLGEQQKSLHLQAQPHPCDASSPRAWGGSHPVRDGSGELALPTRAWEGPHGLGVDE